MLLLCSRAWAASAPAATAEDEPSSPSAAEDERSSPPRSENWPITVGLMSESFGFYPAKAHFNGTVGTEYVYVRRRRYDLVHMAELGYLRHRYLLHGPNLDTGLLNRIKTRFGLYFDLGLKIGMSWYRYPGTAYTLDEDSGHYVSGGDRGFWSFRGIFGVQIGIDLRRFGRLPIKLLARYDQTVVVPLWEQDTPMLGQAIIGGGVVISTNPASWRGR